ncbi:MAG: S-ribosylhomocysteine lyase [Clostridia bacterium]|nr:S-ribosylhomocysteine lyase [Clostridia bacterium]
MEKITSFKLNHNTHTAGFFLSSVNLDIFTYDLRFVTPNSGQYITPSVAHTIEHLFATVIRNSPIKQDVIYFGPMGCRTGFYLLLRNVAPEEAQKATIAALKDSTLLKSIPGNKKIECGNYKSHNLPAAIAAITEYISVIENFDTSSSIL